MKTLYLVRHAKSSHDEPGLADHERPLSQHGRRAAAAIGRYLAEKRAAPGLVLCSTAARARETVRRAMDEWRIDAPVEELRSLYLAAPEALLAEIRALDDSLETVVLVGHNPGMAELAQALLPALNSQQPTPFPTGAVATFSFDVNCWRDVAPGRGRLDAYVTPGELETAQL